MSTIIDTPTLKRAVATVKPASNAKSYMPCLTWAVLRSDGAGETTITCTDLDVIATMTMRSTGTPLELAVPVKALADAIPAGKGETTITLEDGVASFHFGDGRPVVALRAEMLEDYPRVTHSSAQGSELAWAPFAAVLPAASSDPVRPILTGILLQGRRVVATGSYRLHLEHRPDREPEFDALVPARLFRMIAKAKPESFRLAIGVSDSSMGQDAITAHAGALTVTMHRIEGQFPAFDKLIPTTLPHAIDLAEADAIVQAARKVSGKGSFPLKLHVKGAVTASGGRAHDDAGAGTVQQVLSTGRTTAPDMTVAYNAGYLADALVDTDGRLELTDHLKPAILRTGSGLRLLMPVRIA